MLSSSLSWFLFWIINYSNLINYSLSQALKNSVVSILSFSKVLFECSSIWDCSDVRDLSTIWLRSDILILHTVWISCSSSIIHVTSDEKYSLIEDHEIQMVQKVYSNLAISLNISSEEWSSKWFLHENAQLKTTE